MRLYLVMFLIAGFASIATAQNKVVIPASVAAYVVPAENDEDALFNPIDHSLKWEKSAQKIEFHFYLRDTGLLQLSLQARNAAFNHSIKAECAGQQFPLIIPRSTSFKTIKVGNLHISNPGFYTVTFSATNIINQPIGLIQSIQLSGTASNGIHFNPKPRRNAASVHLKYPIRDTSSQIVLFYNELTVPAGYDHLHSYYMACGFGRGYLGMQVNSSTERRMIFSVWDAGNEAVDRNKVADSNKVQLLAKGEDVIAEGFGNEGTGGHSHWVFPWTAGTTYRFIVYAIPDTMAHTTIYTGYVFLPELQRWKLLASFKAPKDGHYLNNLYSFNEDFSGVNGQLQRKAYFSNQWIQQHNGRWQELTEAIFSCDATGRAKDRIDFGGGMENNRFYLWNGGFQPANAAYGDKFTRNGHLQRPLIEWVKNADSAAQAIKDKDTIIAAVVRKQIDTTASVNGVYYQLLKEGQGEFVKVTDTVSVFYKGTLLKDGSIFDQTKGKPAVFPLNRLIKGWQIGLPACKVGGSIRLYIPSGLAYSIRSMNAAIPVNSIMVFDIDVVAAKHLNTDKSH